jgi:hypothetical protein
MTHLANDHIEQRESCGPSEPPLNKAAWLEALAVLEAELVAFQNQRLSPLGSNIIGAAPATQVTASDTA